MKRNLKPMLQFNKTWAISVATSLFVCGSLCIPAIAQETNYPRVATPSQANPASISTENWIPVADLLNKRSQPEPKTSTAKPGLLQRVGKGALNDPNREQASIDQTNWQAVDPSLTRSNTRSFQQDIRTWKAQLPQNEPVRCNSTCLIPNTIESAEHARRASYNPQEPINLSDPSAFGIRPEAATPVLGSLEIPMAMPTPLGQGLGPYVGGQKAPRDPKASIPGYKDWNPDAGRDEYVFDGSDRGEPVQVDQSWNVTGLQTEDTVGHFDTLDGRRIVTPSNRVAIYAPRFAAVRKIDGVFKANINLPVQSYERKLPVALAGGTDESATTKQHLAVERHAGMNRASEFIDETRGVVSDNVTHLFGIRNTFEPFENLSLMRYGNFSSGETARLSLGLQSALVWEDDLGLQVTVNRATPIITRDVKTVQEILSVKSKDGSAILHVTKIASKIAARTGDFVEFTIRFDNLSGKRIGNVTIIDNLTKRLEYVSDLSECSVKAEFINKRNEVDSLMLRWEITDPIEPHEGGIIRFKCRVR